jgi:23S rRNA (adenine2030-N6)-methyltransferase
MLSYQHGYHAGNLADMHKHALLAWVLDYMAAKDKPLSYIETHAGRALYRLDTEEARKTGEAAAGIGRLEQAFAPTHPYRRAIDMARAAHGIAAYPGSPLIAAHLLRHSDRMTLAELHPREFAALQALMGARARVERRDGLELALSLCPPMPRRGVLMIDPSYEVKTDYTTLPDTISALHRKWNVGVILLWYPVLQSGVQAAMVERITASLPDARVFEARFAPIRDGHRMIGSGLVVLNAPWGMEDEAQRVADLVAG